MATPAQTITGILERGHEKRQNEKSQEKHDEREAKLQTLVSSGLPPQQVQQGIRDIYGQDAPALQRHVENLFRRVSGKEPQQAQAPKRAAYLTGLEAQGKSLPQQQADAYKSNLQTQQDSQFSGNERTLQWYQGLTPEQQKAAAEAGVVPGASSGGSAPYKEYASPDGKQRDWFPAGHQPASWNATGGASKPTLPQLKQIQGQDVLWDPTQQKVVKVFGPHGSARITNHQAIQTDADGTPHIVNLTSVSTPGGGSVQVDAPEGDAGGDEQASPAPSKQPAPRKSGGAAPHAANGDRTLPFTKGTPAFNKVQGEYAEAVKLDSIAQQVAQNPNDAINQKRLAVALERVSAGRFTTQALDYIIKAGWGNTLEQWANNPSTGALPADVMRQLVDGAHQNLKASKDAVDAIRKPNAGAPAPSTPTSGGVKGTISLAKARTLPQYKGKTDAEISAAAKQFGYEVKP
jgi:hypothetical protein